MTDIHQWRRKLQPDSSRTPTQPHEPGQRDKRNDAWLGSTPSTHDRRSWPTLSVLLSTHHAAPPASKPEPFSSDEWTSIRAPPYQPDISHMAQTIQTRLLKAPHVALPVQLNNSVMHIIESYGKLRSENIRLTKKLAQQLESSSSAEILSQKRFEAWSTEEHGYRAEIKRLELLINMWKRGTSDPIQIKQENCISGEGRVSSLSPNDKPQMLLELLERSEVDTTSVKAAVEKERKPLRLHSPSAKMTELSKTLSMLGGPQGKLEVGTPPSASMTSIFAKTSRLIAREPRLDPRMTSPGLSDAPNSENLLSADNYSNFSSTGDALPDELSEASHTVDLSVDKDFGAVRNLAEIMASRWSMKLEDALPKVVKVFFGEHKHKPFDISRFDPVEVTDQVSGDPHSLNTLQGNISGLQNQNNLPLDEAKGNWATIPGYHPLILMNSNNQSQRRPFSFYAGDDSKLDVIRSDSSKNLTFQRSASVPDVSHIFQTPEMSAERTVNHPASSLAAIEESPPSTSSPIPAKQSSSGGNSRIPTPSYGSNNAVSQRREISSSSLATVIQRSPATSIKQGNDPSSSSLHRISTTMDHDRKSPSASSSRNSVASSELTHDARKCPPEKNNLRYSPRPARNTPLPAKPRAAAGSKAEGARSNRKVGDETGK